jgi:pimeloyl-ACP methyl ester carboxylesterase
MKKKNILLLRGLIREKRHWGKIPEDLAKLLPEYNILTLDIPGNGEHHHLRSFRTIRQNVLFLRDQWKKRIDYPSENSLVALSLGGMIAMEWSMLFPEDWSKVVLINSSHGALSPIYKRMRPQNILAFLNYALSTSQKRKQDIIYGLSVNDLSLRKKTVDEWTHIAQTAPVKFQNIIRQLWAAINYRKIAATVSVPTHIICSKADKLVNFECSEHIAKHWNCPIVYNESAGHDPSVDQASWLCENLKTIIQS